jgi:CHAD domain-containing protein/HD superfamily phosphodiesterase
MNDVATTHDTGIAKTQTKTKPKLGLRAWMERVLVECERTSEGFHVDPVHDLRVALRRCRSLADGVMAMDPDPSWKDMKKAGKKLFQALGDLRDMQVMQEWVEQLGEASDPVTVKLLNHVHTRAAAAKQEALKDLDQFDRKQWRQWSRSLPRRASRVRSGSAVFKHLALEKWTAAYDLHKRAMRTRSQAALHALRIGIKRFRYTVENFLPREHSAWGGDLKELQDLLGEIHDLDVLWAAATEVGAFHDLESRERWREKVNQEGAKRVERYREKMVGPRSLWRVWRAELPSGEQVRAAALARLQVWAGFLDPDFIHSQRVARLSLQLYDRLQKAKLLAPCADYDPREVLRVAALLHDVGRAKGEKQHHKDSYRMIRGLAQPLGWSARELRLAAVIARYHRGALPRLRRKTMQALELPDRRSTVELAGVLRLANALDPRNGSVPELDVTVDHRSILVKASGYSAMTKSAEQIAAARHLLETVVRRPVMVRALREGAHARRFSR